MKVRGKQVLEKKGLLEKNCVVCQRPFRWRRKWARDWEHVKYCSDACRKRRGLVRPNGAPKQ